MASNCEVKSLGKKEDLKISKEKTTVMLKESVFNEFKKTVTKDRATFKQAQKVLEMSNDK
jgi:hypothetical protein